jgi:GGDEF domain-containing protein
MISKKRKEYLQSIGYVVRPLGGEFLLYLPEEDDPRETDDSLTESQAWQLASRMAKKKVTLLAVITDPEGQFFGLTATTGPACARFDPGLIATRVADDIDMRRDAAGMRYQILDSFNSFESAGLCADLYVAGSKTVTITHYDMETATFSVSET